MKISMLLPTSLFFLALVPAQAAVKAEIVDIRTEEPPIYCNTKQDYNNRLTNLFSKTKDTADYFRLNELRVTTQGQNLVFTARVDFLACVKKGSGYAWASMPTGQNNYDLLAAPPSLLHKDLVGYVKPIDVATYQVSFTRPIADFLSAAEAQAFNAGKDVYAIEIYTGFLSKGAPQLRLNAVNPASRLIVDFIQK